MPGLHSAFSALLVLSAVGGCGARGQGENADPEVRSESLRGRVVVTGSEPLTTVTLMGDNGESSTILGDLAPELRRLGGATVRVQGSPRHVGPGKGLDVESYDVLLIDGLKPVVGILAFAPEGQLLTGKDTLELASVPPGLQGKPGAKVWIVGRRAGSKIEVQSFGVLREASR